MYEFRKLEWICCCRCCICFLFSISLSFIHLIQTKIYGLWINYCWCCWFNRKMFEIWWLLMATKCYGSDSFQYNACVYILIFICFFSFLFFSVVNCLFLFENFIEYVCICVCIRWYTKKCTHSFARQSNFTSAHRIFIPLTRYLIWSR